MGFTLAELARQVGGSVRGDATVVLERVAPLTKAGPGDIAFVAASGYRRQLRETRASAVILRSADAEDYTGNALVAANPQLSFAHVAAILHPPDQMPSGCDPSASVSPEAVVAGSAHIGPQVVIEAGAVIGEGVVIGPACVIGRRARIGADCRLHAHVVIAHDCVLGARCQLQSGAVIGSDGFGYARDGEHWVSVPQLGRVVIGNDVDIGANTTIDRGTLEDTVIGDGVKLDNLIQIAHNVQIGEHTAMAGCVGVAGSAVIGKRCTIGGGVGIAGHLTVGDDVHVTGMSLVGSSLESGQVYSSSLSAVPAGSWRRNVVRLRQLDELVRRVKELESQLQQVNEGNKT